jgi:hypothetical protein
MCSPTRRDFSCLFAVIVGISIFCSSVFAGFPKFEYHLIDRIGRQMGQTSLVDVDKDGDLDWMQWR